ncbi:hypothetical protein LCGC14_1033060 [marine sediment metagenome]|uniref:Uncharacterized protein n=1 Tax=marine sediment metagenome TaxID=412755 RepID=A0A0F9R053_9ZZZZ
MKPNNLSESLHRPLKAITEEMEEIKIIEEFFFDWFPIQGLQIRGAHIEGSIYRLARKGNTNEPERI